MDGCMKLLKHIILRIPGSAFLRTRFTTMHRDESEILRELSQSNVRALKPLLSQAKEI